MELQPLFLVAHFWFRMLPQGTRCVAQIIWFEFWFSFDPETPWLRLGLVRVGVGAAGNGESA